MQLLILPSPEPEDEVKGVLQSPATPAAVLRPAEVAEEEADKPQEPLSIPNAEPLPQTSLIPDEAAGEQDTEASEPETLEREVSVATGANGSPSSPPPSSPSPGNSRDVVIAPRPLSAIDPLFPIGSRIRGEQGDVRFQIWISAAGRLERTQILQTSGYPALDEAAERALKKTRFAPGNVNGSAVPGTLTITVHFRLEQ